MAQNLEEKEASATLSRVYLAVLLAFAAVIMGWPYVHQHFH